TRGPGLPPSRRAPTPPARHFVRGRLIELVPHPHALLRLVLAEPPVVHQHVQRHVFRHPHGDVGIDDANDRYPRQARIADDLIGAGSEREYGPELWKAGEPAARRIPDTGIAAALRNADTPGPKINLR